MVDSSDWPCTLFDRTWNAHGVFHFKLSWTTQQQLGHGKDNVAFKPKRTGNSKELFFLGKWA